MSETVAGPRPAAIDGAPMPIPPDAQLAPVASIRGTTSLAGDLAAIGSGRITAAVLSLATALITTRILGPAGYGTVAMVGIISMLVFIASTAWTGISIRRYGREDFELTGTMSRLTWNRALIGLPLMVISMMIVVGLKAAAVLPATITWQLVGIALATGLINIIVDHCVCLLETSGRMKASAGGQVLSQAAYVAALAIMVGVGVHATPQDVLILSLASASLLAIGVAPLLWRVGVVPVRIDRQLLRRMLWLSTPVIGLMVSQYVFGSIDIVVLRLFTTTRDVGVYAVAYQAYTVLSAAAVTATAVFVPLFVSLKMAGRDGLIKRYLTRGVPQGLFIISVVGGLAVTPLGVLVPIVFGKGFRGAATPMAILVVGLAFLFAAYLVAPILTLHEQTRTTAVINAIAAVINVAADFLLIGVFHMGVVAPAIATSGALAFTFVAFYLRAERALRLKASRDLAVVIPLLAGAGPTFFIQGVLGMVIGVLGVAITTSILLLVQPPFGREDAELIGKLELPDVIKRAAVKAILLVS